MKNWSIIFLQIEEKFTPRWSNVYRDYTEAIISKRIIDESFQYFYCYIPILCWKKKKKKKSRSYSI